MEKWTAEKAKTAKKIDLIGYIFDSPLDIWLFI
jgi:hypothetical protein